MAYYMHNVPGRLRVKSPVFKRNPNASDDLKKILSSVRGIATVDINPTTGSLLINYNHHIVKHDEIIHLLQRKGYFDASKAATNDEYLHRAASKAGSIIGRSIFGTFAGLALEGTPLAFLAVLI
jgi:copper chaperone CopZ